GLSMGVYHVKQVLKSGFRKTHPPTSTTGNDLPLLPGLVFTKKDFGNTTNVYLAGTVFNDANSNGVRDPHDDALPNVIVNVVVNNTIVASRTTNSSGFWQIKG